MEAEGNSAQPTASSPMEHVMPVTVDRIRRSDSDRGFDRHEDLRRTHHPARDHAVPEGRPRLVWAVVAMLVIAFFAVLVLAGISALGVRRHLLDGRDALDRGKSDLIDGDAAAAQSEFDSAHEAFRPQPTELGRSGSRSPARSGRGEHPDVVRAVADAGLKTADAASGIGGGGRRSPGRVGRPRSHGRRHTDPAFGGVDGSHRTSRQADGGGTPDAGGCSDADRPSPGRLRAFGGPGTAWRRCIDSCTPARRSSTACPRSWVQTDRATTCSGRRTPQSFEGPEG